MHGSGSPLQRLAREETYGEVVRFVGLGLLLMALTSPAFAAERYVEIWNPPEAQSGMHRGKVASQASKHKRPAPRLVKAKTYPSSAITKLAAKPRAAHNGSRRITSDVPNIPRQITPEGNVLRVDAHASYVEVVR